MTSFRCLDIWDVEPDAGLLHGNESPSVVREIIHGGNSLQHGLDAVHLPFPGGATRYHFRHRYCRDLFQAESRRSFEKKMYAVITSSFRHTTARPGALLIPGVGGEATPDFGSRSRRKSSPQSILNKLRAESKGVSLTVFWVLE